MGARCLPGIAVNLDVACDAQQLCNAAIQYKGDLVRMVAGHVDDMHRGPET